MSVETRLSGGNILRGKVAGSAFPSGGNAGDVMTMTENGAAWEPPAGGNPDEESIYGELVDSATISITAYGEQDTGIELYTEGGSFCYVIKCESTLELNFYAGDYSAGTLTCAHKASDETYTFIRLVGDGEASLRYEAVSEFTSGETFEIEVYLFNSASLPDTPVTLWRLGEGYSFYERTDGSMLLPVGNIARYSAIEIVCKVSTDGCETVSSIFSTAGFISQVTSSNKTVVGIYDGLTVSSGKLQLSVGRATFSYIFSTYVNSQNMNDAISWNAEVGNYKFAVGSGNPTTTTISTDPTKTMRPLMVIGYK